MFKNSIKNGFRKTLFEISNNNKKKLDRKDLLKHYLDETEETNTILTKYQYNNHTLFKDCFNNLYYKINGNSVELIGYINDNNEIIFDKLVKKTFEPKKEKKKTKEKSKSKS